MSERLIGLDIARYLAFVGMVLVNFDIVMSHGVQSNEGFFNEFIGQLQGRASATFVVLAGIGLGLSSFKKESQTVNTIVKRSIFLLILGLLNMTIFEGDILHYYAFYFLFGVFLLPFGNRALILVISILNLVFFSMMLFIDYESGWNFEELTYSGFWTIDGFTRNLFFNGFHPVFPWLGFFLLGMLMSRVLLKKRQVQIKMISWSLIAIIFSEIMSFIISGYVIPADSELQFLFMTDSMPPMPLYFLAASGSALLIIGLCLLVSEKFKESKIYSLIAPAGTQTLTLYVLHIIVGLGFIDAIGFTGTQTSSQAFVAAIIFCILGTIFAFTWSKWFRRGIFESLMRKLTG
ncbi:MAG: heparan-alpha-glucosaminide N-acetyltransferase domain-containing protein [Pseudomonadota bacterium]|nr:heparan-alpha-glucosaminide N-acetyltransferase domain-containing protein [Pseudomonadota bacterium]